MLNNLKTTTIKERETETERQRHRETENALVPVTVESVVLEKKIKCLEMR